jgi:hypothetical protein
MNKIEFKKLSLQVVKSINDGTLDIPTIQKMVDKLKNGYSDYATRDLWNETLRIATNYTVGVGDGVTYFGYSDRDPYTVIARTPKTLTIQQDKCVPDMNHKDANNGFTNENQKWIITPDKDGQVTKVHWSVNRGCWLHNGHTNVGQGRIKFYDYNF